MKKVAIIGGGIAGITAANELSKNRAFDVTIFEKNDRLGGLNESIEINNLFYDIGAFHYSDEHAFLKTYPFLKEIFVPISNYPITIKDKNKRDIHPISIKGYWKNFGTINLVLSAFSLLYGKFKYANYKTLPEYCKYYLGDRIYRKSGVERYIQRLYKKKDVDIDIKFGYSRMGRLRHYSIRKILGRLTKLKKETVFNAVKKDRYARPRDGFGGAFRLLERHLLAQNVAIKKGVNVQSMLKEEGRFIVECDGDKVVFDRVISTVPLSITQKLTGIQPSYRPTYVKLLSLFYKGTILPESNIIYNFTKNGEWKRIIVFSKYYGLEDGQDYFSVEVTVDSTEESHIESCKKEFEEALKTYEIAENVSFQGLKVIPFAYPVFNKGETHLADQELKVVKDFGIDLIGRQGTFQYMSSDATIRTTQKYITEYFVA